MSGTTRGAGRNIVRAVACVVGCVALAMSVLLFLESRLIGFPDGFITDHDRVREALLIMTGGASLLGGLGFVALGWVGPSRIGRKLGVASLAYGVLIALTFIVDSHLQHLAGRGG